MKSRHGRKGPSGGLASRRQSPWPGSFEARATYVLHLERGEWKVVQVHWSLPRANVEVFGRTLTVSLEVQGDLIAKRVWRKRSAKRR